MASSVPTHPSANTVAALLPKLSDADSDYRFMSLNDLYTALSNGHPGFLLQDFNTAARVVEGILKTLDDQNGEVQNLAIKCLAPLVLKVPPTILSPLVDKLSNLTTEHSVDRSVPATALRTVVTTFPRPVPGLPPSKAVEDAYVAISRVLIPRLVGHVVLSPSKKALPEPPRGILQIRADHPVDGDAVDVLIEVVRCFGPMLQDAEIRALQKAVMDIVEADRAGSVVKKRAVVAISVLALYFSDELLSAFVSQLIESFRNPHLTSAKRRLFITIIGSMARSIPQRFGPYLKTMAPFILSAISQEELAEQEHMVADDGDRDPQLDELRESALVALESCLASCSTDMRPYTTDAINAALLFLRYDPNFTDEGDDEDMGGTKSGDEGQLDDEDFEQEEDFEEEGGFSDDDDLSWKVRRCAAKVLYTLISTRASGDLLEDGTLYDKVAPVLVDRFKEREENVRLENLITMSALVRKTGEGVSIASLGTLDDALPSPIDAPQSRKRRRGGSEAGMFDPPSAYTLTSPVAAPLPSSGPLASLARLSPAIVRSMTKLLQGNSLPTKQASISLLGDIVTVQRGGLSEYLNQLIGPIVDAIKSTGTLSHTSTAASSASGAATATTNSLRVEALRLTAAIAETHATSVLLPHLTQVVPAVVSAARDRFYKISSEALAVVEHLVKVLTPPRLNVMMGPQEGYLSQLYSVVIDRVSANDADLEVRQRAIHALGVLLARTSGPEGAKLLAPAKRSQALDVLLDRLRNEITRLVAVRAVDVVASFAAHKNDFSAAWVRSVAVELGAQLRKADRALRGSSLSALKHLVLSPAGRVNVDDKTIKELVDYLLPLVTADDLHLLGPTLIILARLVAGHAKKVVTAELTTSLCALVLAPLTGLVLNALLLLVQTIGEEGVGRPLMQGLLKDVGVNGDAAVVGKVIGTLVVYGGSTVGVQIEDFERELETAQDDQRKCLALSVLGEVGLRRGASSPLTPDVFLHHFKSKSDQVPLAAAVALGRAGSGKVTVFLPVILAQMDSSGDAQYLLLHSVKEVLQHARLAEREVAAQSHQIWAKLFVAAQAEDNKAIGAECIGRLAMVDPKTFLPMLQTHLKDRMALVRGIVIQAIRYTLTDVDASYDDLLKPVLVPMLTVMLGDSDLENRRLALTTLNSAAHHKADLVLPSLSQLLPLVMKESHVKPELVREVQMGPFRHKVDDGLEVRKSAYETLYALMETAFSRVNVVEFYDRVIAGLGDEHDIRVLCSLMLTKLITLDADETGRRLDGIAEKFRIILSTKPKENAVKQEVEKAEEASKGVLRVSMQIHRRFPMAGGAAVSGQNQVWRSYWEWTRKEFSMPIKAMEEEGHFKIVTS
ncbi:MAG: hypothetical protein M1838_002100 [Thelocarpon superellum]|nr:MAG: hypothetical protein M1838_002100 [Thelocarpon superellum]